MCKPVHSRKNSWTQPKDLLPVLDAVLEALDESPEEDEPSRLSY
jgi:hypothetical protein